MQVSGILWLQDGATGQNITHVPVQGERTTLRNNRKRCSNYTRERNKYKAKTDEETLHHGKKRTSLKNISISSQDLSACQENTP